MLPDEVAGADDEHDEEDGQQPQPERFSHHPLGEAHLVTFDLGPRHADLITLLYSLLQPLGCISRYLTPIPPPPEMTGAARPAWPRPALPVHTGTPPPAAPAALHPAALAPRARPARPAGAVEARAGGGGGAAAAVQADRRGSLAHTSLQSRAVHRPDQTAAQHLAVTACPLAAALAPPARPAHPAVQTQILQSVQ